VHSRARLPGQLNAPLACGASWPSATHGRAALAGRRPPQQPRSFEFAGRLRRTQTFLRALGIDSWEGRAGSRIIRIRATQENTVSTVSSVCDQPAPGLAGDVCDDDSRSVGRYPMGPPCATSADDADGADANAGLYRQHRSDYGPRVSTASASIGRWLLRRQHSPDLISPCPFRQGRVTAAHDADGADTNAAFQGARPITIAITR